MSHGVHAVQHEVEHQIEHEEHGHGGGHGKSLVDNLNKRVALLIAVIALFLAFSETLGKSAQTSALSYNVEASNLWAFYQAKTIRQTVLQAAGELLKYERMKIDGETSPEALKKAMGDRLDTWQKAVARYESEPREREVRKDVDMNPKYGEGRRELMALAIVAERKRDTALERLSPLRGGVGGVPDRHRARIGHRHHRYDRVDLVGDGPWDRRTGIHRDRVFRPHAVHLF